MALSKVNTGPREQEVCGLKWEYEVKVPVLDMSVFVIPSQHVKNGEERLVVLNRVAISAVKSQRRLHPVHVFVRECEDHALRPRSPKSMVRPGKGLEDARRTGT
jgi:integrase